MFSHIFLTSFVYIFQLYWQAASRPWFNWDLLLKGSMEISMYPATSSLIKKNYYQKGPWKSSCTCNSNAFFLAMVHGYVHVHNSEINT